MGTIVLLAVGAFALAVFFGGNDKPTELNADVWVADPEERAQRLAAKVAAWRAGREWTPPEELERIKYRSSTAVATGISDPNREHPARRLVRRHPMRPATWK